MKKILAVLLMVILLFGCTSAFAASDPDFEILTVKTVADAQECYTAFNDYGCNAEMYLTAFGGALIDTDAIKYFDIWLIGFEDSGLKKYDVVYGWSESVSKFVVATNDVIMLFPDCYDEDDYTTYQLFLGAVLDEVNVTYTEMEADA